MPERHGCLRCRWTNFETATCPNPACGISKTGGLVRYDAGGHYLLRCENCRQPGIPLSAKACPACGQKRVTNFVTYKIHGKRKAADDPLDPNGGLVAPDLKSARKRDTLPALQARALTGFLNHRGTGAGDVCSVRAGTHPLRVSTEVVEWTSTIQQQSDTGLETLVADHEIRRPFYVEAVVTATGVGDRDEVPRPLSSFKNEHVDLASASIKLKAFEQPIGSLGDFDRGHLVALMLNGEDNSWQIVPQVRDCNRGAWQAVEQDIARIVQGAAPRGRGVAVNAINRLNTSPYRLKIWIYYYDVPTDADALISDPRVPVYFYAQLRQGTDARAHYLIANWARTRTAYPTEDEIRQFLIAHNKLGMTLPTFTHATINPEAYNEVRDRLAADAINTLRLANGGMDPDPAAVLDAINTRIDAYYAPLTTYPDDAECKSVDQVIANLYGWTKPEHVDHAIAARDRERLATGTQVRYRALQWLFNQNMFHNDNRYPVAPAFNAMASPYDSTAIATVRKYNVWLNGGWMRSDANNPTHPWQDGEANDPYPILDESSGQAFPEVDHIIPKKQPIFGLNSYRNARLVSFAHNHIYREKPSVKSIQELIDEFCAGPSDEGTKRRVREEWPVLYSDVAIYGNSFPTGTDGGVAPPVQWTIDRRNALYKVVELAQMCTNESNERLSFEEVRQRVKNGVTLFTAAFGVDGSCASGLKTLIADFDADMTTKTDNYSLSILSDIPPALVRAAPVVVAAVGGP